MHAQGGLAQRASARIVLGQERVHDHGKPAKKVTTLGKKAKIKVVVDAANEVPSGKVKVAQGQEGRSARAR